MIFQIARLLAASALFVHTVQAAAFPLQLHVQDLGPFSPDDTRAVAVSRDGSVVALDSAAAPLDRKPFAWSESSGAVALDLGTATTGSIFGMSADGSVIVGETNVGERAVIWDSATGALTQLAAGVNAIHSPRAISGDGQTVVGSATFNNGTRAFRWTATTGMQYFGPASGTHTAAYAVNFDGSVWAGSTGHLTGNTVSVRWSAATGLVDISSAAFPGGTAYSIASEVSDDGQTVLGYSRLLPVGQQIFVWRAGLGSEALGTLTGDYTSSSARLSVDGSTVVGEFITDLFPKFQYTAFRWRPADGQVVALLNPLDQRSLSPGAVSADGSVIVGQVVDDGSAFRWTESSGVAPLSSLAGGFGEALALNQSGDLTVGSSTRADGTDRAVLWRLSGALGSRYCGPAVPNSTGGPAEITLGGSNSLELASMTLMAQGLPTGTFGFFLTSRVAAFAPSVPGSQGALCLGGRVGRFVGPGQVQNSGSFGAFEIQVDPGSLPTPTGSVGAAPGESWYFQAWFRDANPASTSNFTDGATVRFE